MVGGWVKNKKTGINAVPEEGGERMEYQGGGRDRGPKPCPRAVTGGRESSKGGGRGVRGGPVKGGMVQIRLLFQGTRYDKKINKKNGGGGEIYM